jgi:hypothetical protein
VDYLDDELHLRLQRLDRRPIYLGLLDRDVDDLLDLLNLRDDHDAGDLRDVDDCPDLVDHDLKSSAPGENERDFRRRKLRDLDAHVGAASALDRGLKAGAEAVRRDPRVKMGRRDEASARARLRMRIEEELG